MSSRSTGLRAAARAAARSRRRIGGGAAAVGLLAMLAGATGGAAQAIAPVAAGSADYGGNASGAVLDTGVLGQAASPVLVGATISESASAVDSMGGLGTAITNELGRITAPANASANSYSKGLGLEAALMGNPIIQQAGVAESVAPPSKEVATSELGPVPVATAAYASLVRAQAQSKFAPNSCILGADIARGSGYTADAQLVETGASTGPFANPVVGTNRANGSGAVDQSISRQRLVKATNAAGAAVGEGGLGILSETRQTIAPTTLLNATGAIGALTSAVVPGGISVEVAGPLVLKAVATGQPGAAYVTYAPDGSPTPTTPVITIRVGNMAAQTVTVQQIMAGGIDITVPNPLGGGPLISIEAGKPARAINGTGAPTIAANGTSASAAVDVVRVQVNIPGVSVADIRIGHMEASAFVPAGGVACPGIGITKVSDKDPVKVGETFTYTITVSNPYDCTLTAVKLVDVVASDTGITFTLGTATPAASSSTADSVTFNDIGPIPPMGTKQVSFPITVDSASKTGQLIDTATVNASCAVGSAQDDSSVVGQVTGLATIDLTGNTRLVAPKVTKDVTARVVTPDQVLPRTGREQTSGLVLGASALAGLAGIGALRRRSTRATR